VDGPHDGRQLVGVVAEEPLVQARGDIDVQDHFRRTYRRP
jgi:hypothetical protein